MANAWDAGASTVHLEIPTSPGETLSVQDDGTGMTREEFEQRWRSLSYNRVQHQGTWVVFPSASTKNKRKAFGRNGKGRHGLFCFADEYEVETWKNGVSNIFKVEKQTAGQTPFAISFVRSASKQGHGTRLATTAGRGFVPLNEVKDIIGSRFIAEPSFSILVNGEKILLTDLGHLVTQVSTIELPQVGKIRILCVDGKEPGRTMLHAGVAWWVNGRLVGTPSWEGLEGSYIDGRTTEAKRYTFIVEANGLEDDVRADWSNFKDTARFRTANVAVRDEVVRLLRSLMRDAIQARKRTALQENNEILQNLSPLSQDTVGQFLDQVQLNCPTLTQRDLVHVTTVLAQLEEARSGYALLKKLAELPPNDLDALHDILSKWTIRDAQIVLDELHRRLLIIKDLERLVEDPAARELADLQPLFERGLWIFGPEYESVHFTSNRTLCATIGQLLGMTVSAEHNERPDFVAIPALNSSIGVFSSDSFDNRGEVNGFSKILILELKRGAFKLSRREVTQAQTYAADLRTSGRVDAGAPIVAIVLGATIGAGLDVVIEGSNQVIPRTYATVIQQAHTRTFRLLEKIRSHARVTDADVRAVIAQKTLPLMKPESAPTRPSVALPPTPSTMEATPGAGGKAQ